MAAIDDIQLARLHNNPTTFKNFVFSQQFTRPNNVVAYALLQHFNNSLTAPTLMSQDLAAQGIPTGALLEINAVKIVSSNGSTNLPDMDVYFFGATFTPGVDGSAITIPLASMSGLSHTRVSLPTASSRGFTNGSAQIVTLQGATIQLPATSSTLYATLIAMGAYTPTANSVQTVAVTGRLL